MRENVYVTLTPSEVQIIINALGIAANRIEDDVKNCRSASLDALAEHLCLDVANARILAKKMKDILAE